MNNTKLLLMCFTDLLMKLLFLSAIQQKKTVMYVNKNFQARIVCIWYKVKGVNRGPYFDISDLASFMFLIIKSVVKFITQIYYRLHYLNSFSIQKFLCCIGINTINIFQTFGWSNLAFIKLRSGKFFEASPQYKARFEKK